MEQDRVESKPSMYDYDISPEARWMCSPPCTTSMLDAPVSEDLEQRGSLTYSITNVKGQKVTAGLAD